MMENLSSFFCHSLVQLSILAFGWLWSRVLHVILGELTANQPYWEVNPAMILFHHIFIVIIYAYSYLVIYLAVCPLWHYWAIWAWLYFYVASLEDPMLATVYFSYLLKDLSYKVILHFIALDIKLNCLCIKDSVSSIPF